MFFPTPPLDIQQFLFQQQLVSSKLQQLIQKFETNEDKYQSNAQIKSPEQSYNSNNNYSHPEQSQKEEKHNSAQEHYKMQKERNSQRQGTTVNQPEQQMQKEMIDQEEKLKKLENLMQSSKHFNLIKQTEQLFYVQLYYSLSAQVQMFQQQMMELSLKGVHIQQQFHNLRGFSQFPMPTNPFYAQQNHQKNVQKQENSFFQNKRVTLQEEKHKEQNKQHICIHMQKGSMNQKKNQKKKETQNILKNFINATIHFAQKKEAENILNTLEDRDQLVDFLLTIDNTGLNIKKIIQLVTNTDVSEKQKKINKMFRILCQFFMKRMSVNYVYSSKIQQKKWHLKYRRTIYKLLQYPDEYRQMRTV